VTDADLVLGFLDRRQLLRRPHHARHRGRGARGRHDREGLGVDRIAAAEGIYRVVNTNMAEGIKLVSVRRGVDPRRFALVSFGGAAGLHITEVARQLEIRRVVVPTVASVLSRVGDAGDRSPLRARALTRQRALAAQAERAAPALRHARARRAQAPRRVRRPVRVRRGLDMRYGEQIFEIGVESRRRGAGRARCPGARLPSVSIAATKSSTRIARPGQEVVVVNVRVAVVGELDFHVEAGKVPASTTPAPAPRRRRVYLGDWVDVPVCDLDTLAPGATMRGPALFESPTTTVLVRDGETVTVTAHGWLDIALG
jgi:N-methylhydantoinase A